MGRRKKEELTGLLPGRACWSGTSLEIDFLGASLEDRVDVEFERQ
jgi:hypothetical protein